MRNFFGYEPRRREGERGWPSPAWHHWPEGDSDGMPVWPVVLCGVAVSAAILAVGLLTA